MQLHTSLAPLLAAVLLLSSVAGLSDKTGLKDEDGSSLLGRSLAFFNKALRIAAENNERNIDCNAACSHRSRGAVCGTNGHTYRSMCELDLAICRKVKVMLKHDGECSLEEKCLDQRRAMQEEVKNGETVHVPTCLADGSFAPVQCHNFSLHCWCSQLDGRGIPGTVQFNVTPECPDRTREASRTASSAAEERCTGKPRHLFITNLSENMIKEYQRERNTGRLSNRKLLKRALKWKFERLDKNRDQKLRRREYRKLKKTVRKFIKPKKCAKLFPRLCDTDNDRSLSDKEWVACFTNPGGKTQETGKKCSVRPCGTRPTTPRPPPISCNRTRQLALEEKFSSNISIPVLQCQANGRYEPVQCVGDICICVDELTGNSLDGTGVRNGTPDCSRPMPHARQWPGCTHEVKAKFMQALKKFLLNKVEGGSRNPGADSSTQSVEEFAARYHFASLDTNNSSFLEGREKKMVKRHFKSNPKLRRCGKKMTTYCDVNYDKKVSLEEWIACVTVQPNDTGEPPSTPDPENPFESILKPEM